MPVMPVENVAAPLLPNGQKYKIVLFKGQSQYDVLRVFIDDLAEGFEEIGYETEIIDMMEDDYFDKISSVQGTVRCFVSFNGNGIGLEAQNKAIYDLLSVPLVSWYVDHPYYLYERLKYPMREKIVLISNENNFKFYCNEYRQKATIAKCLQLGGRQYVDKVKPYAERTGGLVFFGSWIDMKETEESLKTDSKQLASFIWDVIEDAKFETKREFYEVLEDHFNALGIEPKELNTSKWQFLLTQMDTYVRMFRRNHVLSSLGDTPITIYGNNWDKFGNHCPNITFKPPVSFQEAQEIVGNSKLLLNIMPNNRTGIHDRIAYALYQGTSCFSEATPGLKAHFQDRESLFFYDMKPSLPDELPERIQTLLASPELIEPVAMAGKQIVERDFNWRSRAQEIAKALDANEILRALR